MVISSAILVSATNLSAGKGTSGFLFGYLGSSQDNYENPLENKLFLESSKKKDLALVALAQASTSPDPSKKLDDLEALPTNDAFIVGTNPVREEPEEDGGVNIYEVQDGDTISGIASKFKITINTILWANEIDDIDSIKPGDKIFILPTSGLSHMVKKGDTIDSIAKEYKTDKSKIISFNDLIATGEVKEGQELIIPDGEKEIIRPAAPVTSVPTSGIAAREYESFESVGKKLSGKAGTGHKFPYGYCTWYVAQRKYVPWSGNAGTWLYKAKAMGYATGKAPKAGSIIVTTEDKRYGHVAIVEKVNGNTLTLSEMNYVGWGKKSTRTLNANSRVIKGYIYTN